MNKNEFCFEDHKIDVMIGVGVVYILMIIMAGSALILFDFLFQTSIREWIGNHVVALVALFVVVLAGYPLLTEFVYRRWVNRCKKDKEAKEN